MTWYARLGEKTLSLGQSGREGRVGPQAPLSHEGVDSAFISLISERGGGGGGGLLLLPFLLRGKEKIREGKNTKPHFYVLYLSIAVEKGGGRSLP